MTIAACYVSDEGVILCADSTTTYSLIPSGERRHSTMRRRFLKSEKWGAVSGLSRGGRGAS